MDKLQEMILKAKQLAREDIWNDETIRINAAIIRLDKKNAGAYCRLGRCLKENGNLTQARIAYKNASTLDPKYQGYRNALDKIDAVIKEEVDRKFVSKIEKYEEAYQVGMAAKESCDYKLAIMALEKAASIKYSPYALTTLAACYRAEGQLDKSEVIYKDVLSKSDHSAARVGLAATLKGKGKLQEAEELLDNALENNSNNVYALRAKGSVYSKKRQKKEAHTCFQKAFELESEQYINN